MAQTIESTSRLRTMRLTGVSGRLAVFLIGGLPLIVVIVLLIAVFRIAVAEPGSSSGWDISSFKELYGDRFIYDALLNTIGFAVVTVITSLAFAVPIAFLAERTTLRWRGAIFPLMTVGVIVPGFFTAMGWIFMFHPRIGIINQWLVNWIPFVNEPPVNIISIPGMGFIQGLGLSSLAFIMLAGSFRSIDPSLEESAQAHGMGVIRRFRTVTLPLVWPSLLAAGLYVGTIAIASFDVPAIIGLTNRIFTFSTMVFILTNPQESLPNFSLVGASSVLMVVTALFLSWWYLRVISRSHRYAVVTGKGYRPRLIELGPWGTAFGWGIIGFKLMLSLVLPLIMMIWASLVPYFQPISSNALDTISLNNYREIPWDGFWHVAKNTLTLMFLVPTLTAVIGLCISWVVIRSGLRRTGYAFDILAFLPHAVPNLIFAVAAVVLALFWLPHWLPLYGTIWIIVIVYVITQIAFATRLYNSAIIQIHRELDEAGYTFGLGTIGVLWHIVRPLVAPVILYSWLWMALLAYRELTMAAFLITRDNRTLTVFVWDVWNGGDLVVAAALMIMMTALMLPLIIIYFAVGRNRLRIGQ